MSSESSMSIIEPYLSALSHHRENLPRILQLGSGTSDLQNCFRSRGYLDVTNVDYEPLAIVRGRQLQQDAFGDVKMKYIVVDATQLSGELRRGRRFDMVVDKSTVDAVSCGGSAALFRMASGVRECLADNGIWISLSYSSVRFRMEQLPFDVEVVTKIPTPKLRASDPAVYYYCYILRPK